MPPGGTTDGSLARRLQLTGGRNLTFQLNRYLAAYSTPHPADPPVSAMSQSGIERAPGIQPGALGRAWKGSDEAGLVRHEIALSQK